MPKFRKIIKDIQKDRFVRLGDIAQFSKETSDYSEYESGGVNTDTLKRVKIPLPPKEIQDQIAAELMQRRSQANVLRRQAIKEWADAKAQFEKELLGE